MNIFQRKEPPQLRFNEISNNPGASLGDQTRHVTQFPFRPTTQSSEVSEFARGPKGAVIQTHVCASHKSYPPKGL